MLYIDTGINEKNTEAKDLEANIKGSQKKKEDN
jgi:hypothetical protein